MPDNVLKERADRLARAASSSMEDESQPQPPKTNPTPINTSRDTSKGSVASRNNKKSTAPPPPPTSTPPSSSTLVKPPFPPSSKNSAFQLNKRDSDITNDESKKPNTKIRKSINDDEEDQDSDDLEENLELFEPVSKNKPPKSKAPPIPTLAVKTQQNEPRTISSSVSDFQEMERKAIAAGKSRVDRENEKEIGLVRTNSDPKNSSKVSSSVEDGKTLNRWQNLESLNEFNDTECSEKLKPFLDECSIEWVGYNLNWFSKYCCTYN